MLGWAVCLVCYQPFHLVRLAYLNYDDSERWQDLLPNLPWLTTLWAAVILFLVFIYAWSTVCFGLRFSNLTHRGIITSGPYRFVKHPAYLSKNLSWWLISMPFLGQAAARHDRGAPPLLGSRLPRLQGLHPPRGTMGQTQAAFYVPRRRDRLTLKTHSSARTTRKPILLAALSGVFELRAAQR